MRLLLWLALACVPLGAADPQLISYAPADTNFLLGVNLRALLDSPSTQEWVAKIKSNPIFNEFMAKSGFNPLEDVDVMLAAVNSKGGKAKGVFLASGRFQPSQMATLKQEQFVPSRFQGIDIYTKADKEPFSLALLKPALLIGGDPDSVRAAIRRGPSAGPAASLAAKAASLNTWHIWFAAIIPETATADMPDNPQAKILKTIEQVSGGINITQDLSIALDVLAKTPDDAQAMGGMVRMFAGLAASNNRNAKEAAAILEKLVIKNEGNNLRLSLTIPQAELAKMAQQIQSQMMGSAKPAEKPAPSGDIVIQSSPDDMGTVKMPPPK